MKFKKITGHLRDCLKLDVLNVRAGWGEGAEGRGDMAVLIDYKNPMPRQ